MNFEWDDWKAASNLEKHGIRFENAALIFANPLIVIIPDERFDYGEERFIAYGCANERLFVVVFTQDFETETIRIISARKANARERKRYGDEKIQN